MARLAGGRAAGGEEQLGQLPGGGAVFGGLVVAPATGEPGEAHGQPGVVLDLAPGGGVVRGQGQLGAEDLEDQAGLEPDVRLLARVDPGGLVRAEQRRQPGGQCGQVGVGEPGAALGHRAEHVGARVVGGQQHRAVDPGAAAAPGERADDDQVDGIGQLGAVVPLELDPLPAACSGLVSRIRPGRLAHQALAPVGDRLGEHRIQRGRVGDLGGGGQPQPGRGGERRLQRGAPPRVRQHGQVLAVGVQQLEAEQAHGHVPDGLVDAVLTAPQHDLAERPQFARGRVVRDDLPFEDRLGRPQPRPAARQRPGTGRKSAQAAG